MCKLSIINARLALLTRKRSFIRFNLSNDKSKGEYSKIHENEDESSFLSREEGHSVSVSSERHVHDALTLRSGIRLLPLGQVNVLAVLVAIIPDR